MFEKLGTMGKYNTYVWKGVNAWKRKTSGVIVAMDDAGAEVEARQLGMVIHYLKKRPTVMLPRKYAKRIKNEDIVFLMRQLSTLIAAGIPLVQGITVIAQGAEKVKLRAMLLTIRDEIAGGKTFAKSLELFPKYFNPLICGLIDSGEKSGTLEQLVNHIALYLEHQAHLINLIKKAMYYPITVLVIACLIIGGILVFLVPEFQKIYASFGAELPTFTRTIIGISHVIREYWLIVIAGIVSFIFFIRWLKANSQTFLTLYDNFKLRIIIFGKIIQMAIIARVTLTLSITLKAGIPLIDALQRVAFVANNTAYYQAIMHTREEVISGKSMGVAMKETQRFPAIVVQMIEIGEKSGALDIMLKKIADYYGDKVNVTIEGLTTLLEPILIVVIGSIIGIFIFGMYLPILTLGTVVQ